MLDLQNLSDSDTKIYDILTDLLDPKDIELKADVSLSHIKILIQTRFLLNCKDDMTIKENLEDCIEHYLKLTISKQRLSRTEITSTLKALKELELDTDKSSTIDKLKNI